ncbi:MAG: hypothetical protein AAF709_17805 [Pseudomonadota bacterium]
MDRPAADTALRCDSFTFGKRGILNVSNYQLRPDGLAMGLAVVTLLLAGCAGITKMEQKHNTNARELVSDSHERAQQHIQPKHLAACSKAAREQVAIFITTSEVESRPVPSRTLSCILNPHSIAFGGSPGWGQLAGALIQPDADFVSYFVRAKTKSGLTGKQHKRISLFVCTYAVSKAGDVQVYYTGYESVTNDAKRHCNFPDDPIALRQFHL